MERTISGIKNYVKVHTKQTVQVHTYLGNSTYAILLTVFVTRYFYFECFSGVNCEVDISVCNTSLTKCSNGGECIDGLGNSFTCSCPEGKSFEFSIVKSTYYMKELTKITELKPFQFVKVCSPTEQLTKMRRTN